MVDLICGVAQQSQHAAINDGRTCTQDASTTCRHAEEFDYANEKVIPGSETANITTAGKSHLPSSPGQLMSVVRGVVWKSLRISTSTP